MFSRVQQGEEVSRMKKSLVEVSVTVLVLVIVSQSPSAEGSPASRSTSPLQRFSRAHFQFSLDLYSRLAAVQSPAGPQSSNILFSPFSLSTVLSMMFLGAGPGSETSLQLRASLQLNNFSFSEVHTSYKTVLTNLESSMYYREALASVNGVFQQTGLGMSDTYRRALEEYYATSVHAVDFASDPASAMRWINQWGRNESDGRIEELLREPAAAHTRMMLVNGLSFRSQWLYKFDRSMTFDKGLFYTTTKTRYEIPMMVGRFRIPVGYSSDLECRIAELPFASKRISLFIILPDDVDRGLAKLEANMSSDNVRTLFSTLKDEVVNIRMPRFRLRQDMHMTETLKSLGIVDLFDRKKADLREMSLTEKLYVNDIVHKTYLELNEDGVEAASTTVSGLNRIGAFGEKYFEVDHPFVFFLWDYHSGILLFLGRVTAPEPWLV